jgi:hypothetical protein
MAQQQTTRVVCQYCYESCYSQDEKSLKMCDTCILVPICPVCNEDRVMRNKQVCSLCSTRNAGHSLCMYLSYLGILIQTRDSVWTAEGKLGKPFLGLNIGLNIRINVDNLDPTLFYMEYRDREEKKSLWFRFSLEEGIKRIEKPENDRKIEPTVRKHKRYLLAERRVAVEEGNDYYSGGEEQ